MFGFRMLSAFAVLLAVMAAVTNVLGSPILDRLFASYGLDTSVFDSGNTNHNHGRTRQHYYNNNRGQRARPSAHSHSQNGGGGRRPETGRSYKQICRVFNPNPFAPGSAGQPLCY